MGGRDQGTQMVYGPDREAFIRAEVSVLKDPDIERTLSTRPPLMVIIPVVYFLLAD